MNSGKNERGLDLSLFFGFSAAVAENCQLHGPLAKAHCFARAGNPDIDVASANGAAGIGNQVLA